MDATPFTSHMRKLLLLMVFLLGFTTQVSAVQQLTIGQAETVYLNPSLPADAWITSAGWSTDKVGLNYFDAGTWGTGIRVDGYWSGTATLSCFYSYSYYGIDGHIHVGSGNEYWYFTCQGYPVSITPTDVILDKGETASLKFSITGASIGKLPAVWESSDKSVATVYSTGDYTASVQAKSPGSCTITCYSYMGEPVVCNVTVNSFPPTSISLSPSEAEITEGESVTIKCTLYPSGASSTLTWNTEDNTVATVKNGRVMGVAPGTTRITVVTANGLSDYATITVTEKWRNPRGSVSTSLKGNGTSDSPYLIGSASDLRFLADKVNAGADCSGQYFKQITDIEVIQTPYDSYSFRDQELWIPIGGKTDRPFCGIYDGDGHGISGLCMIDNSEVYKSFSACDLFGLISKSAIIRNIKLSNVLVDFEEENSNISHAGSLVGMVKDGKNFQIENCHFLSGRIFSRKSAGGLIGTISAIRGNNAICQCSNHATVMSLGRRASGIAYSMGQYVEMYNCINTGDVSCNGEFSYASGIVGVQNGGVYNCINSGTITGRSRVSGITETCTKASTTSHCVNYGQLHLLNPDSQYIAAIFCYNNAKTLSVTLKDNYYLSDYYLTVAKYSNCSDNHSLSISEMKSTSTIEALNSNGNDKYSKWVSGYGGYPTFDWALALDAGVEDIKENESTYDNFFCLPNDTMVSLYSTQGQLLYRGTKEKMPHLNSGIFLIVCDKGTYKVKL